MKVFNRFSKKLRKEVKEGNPYRDIFLGLGSDHLECGFEATAHNDSCEEMFLNRFNESDILTLLKEIGLTECLSGLGFNKLHISIDLDEGGRHHLSIYHSRIKPENMLINLRLSETIYKPEITLPFRMKRSSYNMINIEWAQTTSPTPKVTQQRPLLPGQAKPGLGILSYLMLLMQAIGKRISSDGFIEVPDHFHLAAMYAGTFKFIDPSREALLQGVLRDLGNHSIGDLSWGFITSTITDTKSGRPAVYTPGTQAICLTSDLQEYFNSSWYEKKFNRSMRASRYSIDMEQMQIRRSELLEKHKTEEI